MNWIKHKVSGTRRRNNDSVVDIDLTYICFERIIVMSYPSSGLESNYRNHYKDVCIIFFQTLFISLICIINIGKTILRCITHEQILDI